MKRKKEEFYDLLQRTIDEAEEEVMIMGDFNGRVGNQADSWMNVIGTSGEEVLNNDGERILQLSIANQFVIANTKFKHKEIQLYTREEPSRNERSTIDYIIVTRNTMKKVRDARVKRGPEIGSDHYLLILEKVIESEKRREEKRKNK
jgi:endonuclease/exonuclease/phosphatase family metal-dependent hydrolase